MENTIELVPISSYVKPNMFSVQFVFSKTSARLNVSGTGAGMEACAQLCVKKG